MDNLSCCVIPFFIITCKSMGSEEWERKSKCAPKEDKRSRIMVLKVTRTYTGKEALQGASDISTIPKKPQSSDIYLPTSL